MRVYAITLLLETPVFFLINEKNLTGINKNLTLVQCVGHESNIEKMAVQFEPPFGNQINTLVFARKLANENKRQFGELDEFKIAEFLEVVKRFYA